jgi:hypothetical protein
LPIGTPIDSSLLLYFSPSAHNSSSKKVKLDLSSVPPGDKCMIQQDLTVCSSDTILRGRVIAAQAIGRFISIVPDKEIIADFILSNVQSPWAFYRFIMALTVNEWAKMETPDSDMYLSNICNRYII